MQLLPEMASLSLWAVAFPLFKVTHNTEDAAMHAGRPSSHSALALPRVLHSIWEQALLAPS